MLKEGEQRLNGVLVRPVQHWQEAVITPRAGLPLGPLELFTEFLERRVRVVSLEES